MVSTLGITEEFPVWGLLPRKETGALNLINKYPKYDGRGVVIAIFDSGVDPAAPGLQVTPDNEVKVIDRIDASGAGDIDTSTVVESEAGESVAGLTGRQLKIPSMWENPSKKYHLGVVHLFNLYPQRLRERVTREKKEKSWDMLQRAYVAKAQKHVQTFEKTKASINGTIQPASENVQNNTGSQKNSIENDSTPTPGSESPPLGSFLERLPKENAEAELALLKGLEKKYSDLGPTYDCVVFHDGKCWRACIDSSEEGDLGSGILLGEYRITHEYRMMTSVDQYTITVNVHNDGNILEIVGMCSSHGTHVASIASGYFPNAPEKNGVAPSAKIVSITIGDNRLGSMETGTSLVRAMARVMENPYYKVDVINMSYGEHAHWSNAGRLGEIAYDVVNKYGVTWVASAGNHGPALCTVGVPPDFANDFILGVGAYVSPEMMAAEYSMTEKLPGRPYTWSSRSPTVDGGRGVSVCAPGGAITSVPKFTLKGNQLMNGTSMASPHTAGCVALLISAMKQKGVPYTPYSIRRAIENTAMALDTDPFAQGHGLIKVDKALDYLAENGRSLESKVRFGLECGRDRAKGIHVRNWKADRPVDLNVTVEPFIFDETRADAEDKLALNFELVLSCEESWVKCPVCLQLSYTARTIKVTLDPAGLTRGCAYFTSVKAFISSQPEKGPVFEIPITMIVPHVQLPLSYQFTREAAVLKSGQINRHFVMVPLEATYASVTVKVSGADKTQRFTIHMVQIKPSSSVTTLEFYKVMNLGPNESSSHVVAVQGGLVLEICLARWWSCLVEGQAEIVVDFHSLCTTQETVSFANSDGVHRLDVKSGLRSEELSPQASLKHHGQVIAPSESKIEVLGGERDTLPEGRIIYQLILTYNIQIAKSGVEVTPKCCLLNNVLYESSFESQLWMLFDSGRRMVSAGDAFCSKYNAKLDKGSYVLKMHIRHEKNDLLEKLSDMPITLLSKLTQEVKLDLYSSYSTAVTNGRKVQSLTLTQGSSQPLYIMAPNLSDKNLKSLSLCAGDFLLGSVGFGKDEAVRKADSYTLRLFITELPSKKKNCASGAEEKKDPKTMHEYEEALRDFNTGWLVKLEPDASERLLSDIRRTHPDHLPASMNALIAMDNSPTEQYRQDVIARGTKILANIAVDELLTYYGTKTDVRQDAAKIKTQMERQKNIYLETTIRLGLALYSKVKENAKKEVVVQEDNDLLEQCTADILKFVDATDSKVINFFIKYYQYKDCKALACKLLTKLNDDKPTKENDMRLIDMYTQLDWCHASKFFRSIHDAKFPPGYARF